MKKDIKKIINNNICEKVVTYANNKGYLIDIYEGCLLDNYIIYNDTISINNAKPRKYIIIVGEYINCWSSQLVMIQTDSEKTLNEYINRFNS